MSSENQSVLSVLSDLLFFSKLKSPSGKVAVHKINRSLWDLATCKSLLVHQQPQVNAGTLCQHFLFLSWITCVPHIIVFHLVLKE